MGEYADMDVDSAVDSWRGGNWMPFWPSAEQAGKPLHPMYVQAIKKCRRCGYPFLFWHRHDDKWRLHHYAWLDGEPGPRFVLHRCGFTASGEPRVRRDSGRGPSGLRPEGAQGEAPQSGVSEASASPNPSPQ